MALKYLPCPWVLFEYWKCDKFKIASRGKCVKNDGNHIRGKIKKGGGKNHKVESWNNSYVLLPLTAMPYAYHYGDAQDAVKSSYNLCSGSGPLTAM